MCGKISIGEYMNIKKKFITFEGCEGVGKSTQLELLKTYLKQTNQPAVFTREPGGTPLAEKIRNLILTEEMTAQCEALLFAAARCEHINKVILPALGKGFLVICDRYLDSSVAYQAFARNLGQDNIYAINSCAVENCLPEATVFIDMNPLSSWRRQKGNVIDNDRMEREHDEFHSLVYQGYKKLANNSDRFISVVPDKDKAVTSQNIIKCLKEKGIIN